MAMQRYPIISTHLWNASGFRTITDEDYGLTVNKDAPSETDPLIVRNGAYFLKMRVAKKLTCRPNRAQPPPPPTAGAERPAKPKQGGFAPRGP